MASEGMHSPVEQFEIKRFIEFSAGGYDISFTNSSLFMLLAMVVGGTFLTVAMSKREMVPGRLQGAAEMMYEFVADMVRSNVGNDGRAYFPFVFTLFVFLLFGNMLGLIPYSYTFTSQIIVTFAMAAFVFVGVTIVGLVKHGLHFFSFFVPQGAPKVLIPFLIVIEVISYFVRPVSLSVRLFANMLAGHTMLKVFAGLAVMISGAGGIAMTGSLLPLAALIGLTGQAGTLAAFRFAAESFPDHLTALDPEGAYARCVDALRGSVDEKRAHLVLLTVQAAHEDHAGVAHHLREGYRLGLSEEAMVEALSYLIWPKGVNCFLAACEVWHGLMVAGEVTPSERFAVWRDLPGQGAFRAGDGATVSGFDGD